MFFTNRKRLLTNKDIEAQGEKRPFLGHTVGQPVCCGDSQGRGLALGDPQPRVQIPPLLLPSSPSPRALRLEAPRQEACSSGLCGCLLMGAAVRLSAPVPGCVALLPSSWGCLYLLNQEDCALGPSPLGAVLQMHPHNSLSTRGTRFQPRGSVELLGLQEQRVQEGGRECQLLWLQDICPPPAQMETLSLGKEGAYHTDAAAACSVQTHTVRWEVPLRVTEEGN